MFPHLLLKFLELLLPFLGDEGNVFGESGIDSCERQYPVMEVFELFDEHADARVRIEELVWIVRFEEDRVAKLTREFEETCRHGLGFGW